MKRFAQGFFKALSAASFAAALVGVLAWSFCFSYQPECPEEIVR